MVNTILIVDDDSHYRVALRRLIERMGYQVLEAESCETTFKLLKKSEVDLIVLDYQLPDGDGLSVIEEVKKLDEGIEIILLTGVGTIELAVTAMKKGAIDFVEKGNEVHDLDERIKKALEVKQLKAVSEFYASTQEDLILVGKSSPILLCKDKAVEMANSDLTVLIEGETGTGKEMMAKYIHSVGARRNKPFVAVNCGHLNSQLLVDDLFGHEKGSFTGADRIRKGQIELADGGTLFLDEIGDMSADLQATLLRFLNDKTYARGGSEKAKQFRGQIIVATNRNLLDMVHHGLFRSDLYYRLRGFAILLPPLRDRKEDIPLLVEFFLEQLRSRLSKRNLQIEDEALKYLIAQDWPGNIRELENIIEVGATHAKDQIIKTKNIPLFPAISKPQIEVRVNQLDEAERKTVVEALDKCGWNQTHAAKFLNIDRLKLIRLMKKHGIAITKGPTFIDQNK